MESVDRKDRKEHLVAVDLLIEETGAILSIEIHGTLARPLAGHRPNEWPARVCLFLQSGSTEKAAKVKAVERLRIERPTWVRYLKSRPGAVPMKGLGGVVQGVRKAGPR